MPDKHMSALLQIRKARGLTQEQVAGYVGVTKATYSAWETGRTQLNAERIVALCSALGCTPNDILGFGESETGLTALTSKEEEIIELFRLQPPNMKLHVKGIMEYTAKRTRLR